MLVNILKFRFIGKLVVEDTYEYEEIVIRNLYIKFRAIPNLNDRF